MSACAVRLLFFGDVLTVPRSLRDSGHEVVVVDPGVTPGQLAAIAVQEDVGLVAVEDAELGAAAVDVLDEDIVVFWVTSAPRPS